MNYYDRNSVAVLSNLLEYSLLNFTSFEIENFLTINLLWFNSQVLHIILITNVIFFHPSSFCFMCLATSWSNKLKSFSSVLFCKTHCHLQLFTPVQASECNLYRGLWYIFTPILFHCSTQLNQSITEVLAYHTVMKS